MASFGGPGVPIFETPPLFLSERPQGGGQIHSYQADPYCCLGAGPATYAL